MIENIYFREEIEEEITEDFPEKNYSRRNRRKAAAKKRKHFSEIAKCGNYPGGYYLSNGRVKRGSRGEHSKYLKNQSNRKIRRKPTSYELNSGKGGYRKEFDYWWELV